MKRIKIIIIIIIKPTQVILPKTDDEVSKEDRNDTLIMNYGNGKYIQQYVEVHINTTVSNKMREMSCLGIHGREIYILICKPPVTTFRPCNCTKMLTNVKSFAE